MVNPSPEYSSEMTSKPQAPQYLPSKGEYLGKPVGATSSLDSGTTLGHMFSVLANGSERGNLKFAGNFPNC